MNFKFALFISVSFSLSLFYSCTKNPIPPPPIHDTVTVVKNDTIRIPPPSPDTPDLKNGLVLYFPFNGNFGDSSGKGNMVTAMGGAGLDYDLHGYAQSAYTGTGNGSRLIVTNNGAYKVDTAFTFSCDFMLRSSPYFTGGYDFRGLQTLASIVNTTTGTGPTFGVGFTIPSKAQNLAFGVNGVQGNDCSSFGTANPNVITDTTQFTPQLGSWYNVICVYSKNTVWVYLNGQLISSLKNTLTASAVFCPDAKFVVGGWWDGGNSGTESLDGKLDEVRFYNRALNTKEIAYLSRNFQLNSTSVKPLPGNN
jgi:Concanavalin A-like lectin/glucanases superfamily